MPSVENLIVAQASGTGIIGDPFAWWGSAVGQREALSHDFILVPIIVPSDPRPQS
jgi:hypothetical protein